MDILNGKYSLKGVAPENGVAKIVTTKLNGTAIELDLMKITEGQADKLVSSGCRYLVKNEVKAAKAVSEQPK